MIGNILAAREPVVARSVQKRKRACRIAKRMPDGGYREPEGEWPRIQDAMITSMINLERVMAPRIAKLRV